MEKCGCGETRRLVLGVTPWNVEGEAVCPLCNFEAREAYTIEHYQKNQEFTEELLAIMRQYSFPLRGNTLNAMNEAYQSGYLEGLKAASKR